MSDFLEKANMRGKCAVDEARFPFLGGRPAIIGVASNCQERFAIIESCLFLAKDSDKVLRTRLPDKAAASKLKLQIIHVPLRAYSTPKPIASCPFDP